MNQLSVYSDVICPWCFIGKQHMQSALAMLEQQGLTFEVSWRPFQLNPDMPRAGVARDEYRRAKFGSLERSRQLDAQVATAARAAGIEIHHARMQRTPNTLDAHRLIAWAATQGGQDAVVDRLFQDYFVDGSDIGDCADISPRRRQVPACRPRRAVSDVHPASREASGTPPASTGDWRCTCRR